MNRLPNNPGENELPKVIVNMPGAKVVTERRTDPMGQPAAAAAAIANPQNVLQAQMQQVLAHGGDNDDENPTRVIGSDPPASFPAGANSPASSNCEAIPEEAKALAILMDEFRAVLETRDPESIRAWKDANWNKIPANEETQGFFIKIEQNYIFAPQPQGPESSPWAAKPQEPEFNREDLPSAYRPSNSRNTPTNLMAVPHNLRFKEQASTAPNSNSKLTKIIGGITLALTAATAGSIVYMKSGEKKPDETIAMTPTSTPAPDKANTPIAVATATAAPAPTAAPSVTATAEPSAAPSVSVSADTPDQIPSQIVTAQVSAPPVSTYNPKNKPPQKSKYDGIMREVPF